MTPHIYSGDDIVIKVNPELIPEGIRILEGKFDDIVNFHEKDVALDMGSITSLDSLLLSVLIRFRSRLFICGRNLRLINCNERIINSIRRADLEDYFLG